MSNKPYNYQEKTSQKIYHISQITEKRRTSRYFCTNNLNDFSVKYE